MPLLRLTIVVLLAALFIFGARFAMTHGHHSKPFYGTVSSVFATMGSDGKPHYFVNVIADNDPLYTEPVEVDYATLHHAMPGQPWVVVK